MSNGNHSPHGSNEPFSPTTSAGAASSYADSPRSAGLSNSKKRKTGTGSRGVANLTPEKLAKKRANDREAQRAIRERTKTQIETLEKRIVELESQQPYQELQNVLHQKKLVELELADIKRRLATVLELIHPVLSNDVLPSLQPSPGGTPLGPSTINGYENQMGGISSENPHTGLGITGPAPASSTGGPLVHRSPTTVDKRSSFDHSKHGSLNHTGEDRRHASLIHGGPHMHRRQRMVEQHQSSSIIHTPLPADHHITLASPITMSHPQSQETRNDRDSRQPWEAVPGWIRADHVFDGVLFDFTRSGQSRRAQGESEFAILGPSYPNFAAISYPEQSIPCHEISKLFRDLLHSFPDVTIIANKVAITYVMFLLARWFIFPTRANFERLPSWIQPNSWQLTIAHPIWIDFVPWPDMRTEMVRSPDLYPFERFFVPHSRTESLNWDHGEAALYAPAEGSGLDADGGQVLSAAFETHLRNLENWTLGPAFASEFPILAASCKITTRGEDERRALAESSKMRARQMNL